MTIPTHFRALLLFLCLGASTAFASTWILTTSTLEKQTIHLSAITPQGISVDHADATTQTLLWPDISILRQSEVAPFLPNAEPFVLYLRTGQRIAGQPVRLSADQLLWKNGLAGEMPISMETVRGFARTGVELPASAGKEDLVQLINKDELKGIVDAADSGLTVQQGAQSSAPIAWDNIKAVVLAQVGNAGQSAAAAFWLTAADASVYAADSLQLQDQSLRLTRQGTTLVLPLSAILRIENRNGKATFLAWLTPSSFAYTPYLQFSDQQPEPMRILSDIRAGDVLYCTAIELRPKTVLTYRAPATGRFRLAYAASKTGGLTDMSFTLTLGGKIVYQNPSIRSPKPAAIADIVVNKDETLTMEVGFGKNFDAQDYLQILDAAFVAK